MNIFAAIKKKWEKWYYGDFEEEPEEWDEDAPRKSEHYLGDADSRRHDHKEGATVLHRKGRARMLLAEVSPDSHEQIRKYIRLTELIPELLQLVDDGLIGMRPAVELSYLAQKQKDIYAIIDREQLTPTHAQTIRMRKLFAEGKLTTEAIEEILLEEKPNQIEHVSIRVDKIKAYLPKDLPKARREEYIIEALRFYLAKAKE